jgi:hypothetical protein
MKHKSGALSHGPVVVVAAFRATKACTYLPNIVVASAVPLNSSQNTCSSLFVDVGVGWRVRKLRDTYFNASSERTSLVEQLSGCTASRSRG